MLVATTKVIIPVCPRCGDWDEPRMQITTLILSILDREAKNGKVGIVLPHPYRCHRPGGGSGTEEVVVWKGDRPRAIQLQAAPFPSDQLYWLDEWERAALRHPNAPHHVDLIYREPR